MLAANQYTFRHNEVCKYLHWQILKDQGLKITESWQKHVPVDTVIHNGIEIMWDKTIITDKKVNYNRPDITIHDTRTKKCVFIDVSIPVCQNVIKKEAEKITKYRDLEFEVQKCWNLRKTKTIPIVIGALGTASIGVSDYLR